jgi:hypothetical protein
VEGDEGTHRLDLDRAGGVICLGSGTGATDRNGDNRYRAAIADLEQEIDGNGCRWVNVIWVTALEIVGIVGM